MILIIIFALLAVICTGIIVFITGLAGAWTDFFAVILIALGLYAAFNILFVLYAFVLSLFINNDRHIEKPLGYYSWHVAQVAQIICIYCRLRIHVSGEELLPRDTRFLFVSNHRSNFDPIVAMDKLRNYGIAFISKTENMSMPIVGKFVHLCCFLPIDRENARNALETINTAADYIKNDVVSFGIYPEGTRSKAEDMLDFHPGSLKIAQKAGVPIVISSIIGTEKVSKRFPRRTDVYLDILEVIPAEEVRESKTVELARRAKETIQNHIIQEKAELKNG